MQTSKPRQAETTHREWPMESFKEVKGNRQKSNLTKERADNSHCQSFLSWANGAPLAFLKAPAPFTPISRCLEHHRRHSFTFLLENLKYNFILVPQSPRPWLAEGTRLWALVHVLTPLATCPRAASFLPDSLPLLSNGAKKNTSLRGLFEEY